MAIPNTKATLLSYCKRQLGYPVVEINVDAQPMMPQPMYARAQSMELAASSDTMKAPSAAAGTSDVSMTINARAILKP